jgi:hypothetical protein
MNTTFAPPSGPASSAPLQPPQVGGSVTDERRHPGVLGTVVAALVMLAVGAFVAIGSSGDEGVTLPEPFSLAAAAQNTVDARSVEFELTVTAGDLGDVTVAGAVDNESKLVSVSTDLSTLLGLDAMPIGDGAIEALFDPSTDVVYISAGALGDLLPGDSVWVSVDLGRLAEKSGTTIDELQNELFVDPAEWARVLLDSGDVVEVGSEIIDGVDTVHYEVTVDLAAALAASPQARLELDEFDIDEFDIDVPDSVTYDVWVTSDNQLRRASFDVAIGDQAVAMVLDMRPSDQPLDAQVPSDSFDITGLLGW